MTAILIITAVLALCIGWTACHKLAAYHNGHVSASASKKCTAVFHGYICRHGSGVLTFYFVRPIVKVYNHWYVERGQPYLPLPSDSMPSISWDDEAPTKVKLTIETE